MVATAATRAWRRGVLTTGLVALLVALLFLLLEAGLRVSGAGAGTRSSSLAYQEVFLPAMIPAERPDGTPTWRTWDPRQPFQAVPREKAPDALRVFVFGGSAAAGLGYSPNVTFARRLEELLERGYPDRAIEVVNLGVVAISSTQVALLVADVAAHYDPDLLVVYSGNNEFLELHARKYRWATAGIFGRLGQLAQRTNIYRFLDERLHGPPTPADVPGRDASVAEEERLTQARIIEKIAISPQDYFEGFQRYLRNIEDMASTAEEHGVPLLLCSVAVNELWRGREDLPEDWIEALLGRPGTMEEALAALDELLLDTELSRLERWEADYRRAVVLRELGDIEGARVAFDHALTFDPHQRRALSEHATMVAAVAAGTAAGHVDTIALFRATAADGIIGFEHFYDYVHLTPRGTAELAVGVYAAMQELDGVPRGLALELEGYAAEHERAVDALERDLAPVTEFLGIGFDPANVQDRDLWKYERMLEALDERLAADPDDAIALAFRGNARAFRQDGAAGAVHDYRRALELDPALDAVRANLERLLAERQSR